MNLALLKSIDIAVEQVVVAHQLAEGIPEAAPGRGECVGKITELFHFPYHVNIIVFGADLAVESGSEVSLDTFIRYIVGNDIYIYFAEKSPNRQRPHDFEDLERKMEENDPKL